MVKAFPKRNGAFSLSKEIARFSLNHSQLPRVAAVADGL
jgi:hypothetical protein